MDNRRQYFAIYDEELDKDYKFYGTDVGKVYLFLRSRIWKGRRPDPLTDAYREGRLISIVSVSQIVSRTDIDPQVVYQCIDDLIDCGRIKRACIGKREYFEMGMVENGQDVFFRPDDEDDEAEDYLEEEAEEDNEATEEDTDEEVIP